METASALQKAEHAIVSWWRGEEERAKKKAYHQQHYDPIDDLDLDPFVFCSLRAPRRPRGPLVQALSRNKRRR